MVEIHKHISDEERTNNQGYFTYLVSYHALIINNDYCNVKYFSRL